LLPQLIVGLRKIPLVPYATPGTWELSVAIEPFVPYYDALLLANHGAVTCGPDLATAFFSMEVIEHAAKTILAAEVTGIRMLMSRRDVLKRVLSRARYVAPGESAGTSEEQIKLKQRGSQSLRQSGR